MGGTTGAVILPTMPQMFGIFRWPSSASKNNNAVYYRSPSSRVLEALYHAPLTLAAPWLKKGQFGGQLTIRQYWSEFDRVLGEIGRGPDISELRSISRELASENRVLPNLARAAHFLRVPGSSDIRRLKAALDALPVAVKFLETEMLVSGGERMEDLWKRFDQTGDHCPALYRGVSVNNMLRDLAHTCEGFSSPELKRVAAAARKAAVKWGYMEGAKELRAFLENERSLITRFQVLARAFSGVIDVMTYQLRA